MSENRPQGRKRNVTGTAQVGQRKGEGLNVGPVGNRPGTGSGSGNTGGSGGNGTGGNSSGGNRSGGNRGGGSPLLIIIAVLVLLLGGGNLSGLFNGFLGGDTGDLSGLMSGNTGNYTSNQQVPLYTMTPMPYIRPTATPTPRSTATPRITATPTRSRRIRATATPKATATRKPKNTATPKPVQLSANGDSTYLNRSVAPGAREKFTQLRGNGRDTVTLMVYMCGTDLESRTGMASKDLQEMASAKFGDNVRIIVYTGGCSGWQIRGISNQVNQIYRVQNGGLTTLSKDQGNASMTNPDTLSGFIRYCAGNFPADRYQLILWDHGGGSVSGFGYDEKYRSSGSMSLPNIKKALEDGGVKFDFIGFDACLMATVETALLCSDYADYLIASEETEPGVGWYYTDWLTSLGSNTSVSTLDLGKQICDTFVSACNRQARGQKTTLSLVDLAELSATVPDALTGFTKSLTGMVKNGSYKQVSNARYGAREFAASTRIDQVDLSDLANRVGNAEANTLISTLVSAVKYNRSGSLTGAYGLSIYFPYQKASNVEKAAKSATGIGMDESYAECIRAFASLEQSGQMATGGYYGMNSPYTSLTGGQYGFGGSGDAMSTLLELLMGGGRSLDQVNLDEYVLNGGNLVFKEEGSEKILDLPNEQWSLIQDIDLNMFYDDGHGYIDLGLDNVFEIDERGRLIADRNGAWIALNGKIVAYYREAASDGETWGYIPVLLDEERAELITRYTEANGFEVVGARRVYLNGETDTIAKAQAEITAESMIQPVCDFYSYEGQYQNSYRFGDAFRAGDLKVTEMDIYDFEKLHCTYRLTDIYQQVWWTNTYVLY